MKSLSRKTMFRLKNAVVLLLGSFLFAVAINVFISPGGLYVGGVTGMLQLTVMFMDDLFDIQLSLGVLVLMVNLPLLIVAWRSVGKRFAVLTIITVVLQSILLEVVPTVGFSDDMMLNAIFGGVLIGIGSGLIFKIGASGGGMDVILQMLSAKFNGPIGKYSFSINIVVIFVAGHYQSWEVAMYTIMTIYIVSVLIDRIHTIHKNLTLYIVTEKEDEVVGAIWLQLSRGITVLEASGAFSKSRRSVLMVVLSSYELYEVIEAIKVADEKAFVNVVRSEAIIGNYITKKI